ncbi:dynein light chain Tctex-type protein 2 isoform X2 [Ambystoma mexicanum]|uniref:dynein light chain Tctex-type protein 2 isoform X2 n=1 Tax=Ambystoma mexicanum TaxID=8296 RepID=UPI0037E74ABB
MFQPSVRNINLLRARGRSYLVTVRDNPGVRDPTVLLIVKFGKLIKMSKTPAKRKRSMFAERDSYAGLMKERMKDANHHIVATEPGISEEDGFDDLGRSDSITMKPSIVRLKYANTYRMEPHKKFQVHLVEAKAEQILKDKVTTITYDPEICAPLCISMANEILAAVKEMGFDRYKYVVRVTIAENKGQGMNLWQSIVTQNILKLFDEVEIIIQGRRETFSVG